jgi:twinkle protein
VQKFIEWKSLPFKRYSGKEKVRCPSCDEQRSDKRDKSLQVSHDDGFGKCHYCSALTFKDQKPIEVGRKIYTAIPPNNDKVGIYSKGLSSWCIDVRNISEKTLIGLGITEEKRFQPALNTIKTNIVFNYYEGDTVVNKKFRSKEKAFTSETGGKPILYNINAAVGAEELWIVEGEFDVAAMKEWGVDNVVGLPNGANDNDEYWINSEKYIKDVKRFIIGTDNDEKGILVRDKIAQRLGRYRCKYVEWRGKDANEDLINGDIDVSISLAKSFPVGGTHSINDLYEHLVSLYENGLPETISPKKSCFGELPKIFTTMKGHLVVGTGIPSHGKSSFTDWYLLNIIDEYPFKMSLFSPEHSPMELHLSKYASLAIGKPFFKGSDRITMLDLERFRDWSNERIYFTSAEDGEFPTWTWLFNKMKEQLYTYGINIFVIDAFNKVGFDKGQEGKSAIDSVLTKLTLFAQMNDVIIFLIAHPTKMKKDVDGVYEIPSLYDVSGSSDFRNQTHDGYTIYRYFGNEFEDGYNIFVNLKTKFDFQGKIGGIVRFSYHLQTGRYFADGCPPYLGDMTIGVSDVKQERLDEVVQSSFYLQNDNMEDAPF